MAVNIGLIILIGIVVYGFLRNMNVNRHLSYELLNVNSTSSLRGLAIIIIIFSHICQAAPELKNTLIGGAITYRFIFSWGAIGVAIFFFLSGYGCYFAINKSENKIKWEINHIIKILVHFIVVFMIIVFTTSIVVGNLNYVECLIDFICLRLPGTSTWYLKIQLLFYLILFSGIKLSIKKSNHIIVFEAILYVFIAKYVIGLPDYWWKTALCFPAGCFVAQNKDYFENIVKKCIFRYGSIAIGILAYALILKDGQYRIYIQLPSYVLLASAVCILWDYYFSNNWLLQYIGNASLDLYLIHIGIVDALFLFNFNFNIKILIFIAILIIITPLCKHVTNRIIKKCIALIGWM